MFGLGTWEIVLILVVALIFIGPGKLPELAKTVGKGVRDLRRAMAGFEREIHEATNLEGEKPKAGGPPPAREAKKPPVVAPAAGAVSRGARQPNAEGPDAESANRAPSEPVGPPEGAGAGDAKAGEGPATEPSAEKHRA